MRLTPGQYADRYRNLEVYLFTDEQAKATPPGQLPIGGSWAKADIIAYRLNLKTAYQSDVLAIEKFKSVVRPHYSKSPFEITVWVKTAMTGVVESRTYTDKFALAENMNDPFYGKGSPEECQIVLQLAVRYGLFPREKLQIYCTNGNIGLDCNGFVGNYLRNVVQGKPWWKDARSKAERASEFDANTSIPTIMTFGSNVAWAKEASDLYYNQTQPFLLAMCNERGQILDRVKNDQGEMTYGHIMITEPGTARPTFNAVLPGYGLRPREMSVDVWESAGGAGLSKSNYVVLPPNKHNAFHVYRGLKNSMMWVRMAKLLI